MTLQEYVATYCPDGPGQLRKLILERAGVRVPYAYCWKWLNPKKPAAVSVETAAMLQEVTQGKCTMHELMSLKVIRAQRPARPRRKAKAAAKSSKPKRPTRDVASKLRKRVAELEAQLTQLATEASRVA
jgi:hypothetical protein